MAKSRRSSSSLRLSARISPRSPTTPNSPAPARTPPNAPPGPRAPAAAMGVFLHGYRRFPEDVAILVTSEGLARIHRELEGPGYLPPFQGSKNLRDTEHGVRIEFLVAGQFPGDGKPKPVAFPDPAQASVDMDGVRYLSLPELVELKRVQPVWLQPSRARNPLG